MAKQIGDYKITGTIDGITFYKMEGQYYARLKSSLDGKRVKRDPRFQRTMEWARRLARSSQLASQVYRSLPRVEQVYTLYKELKSLAIKGLKEGKSEEAVVILLQQRVKKPGIAPTRTAGIRMAPKVGALLQAPALFGVYGGCPKQGPQSPRPGVQPPKGRRCRKRCGGTLLTDSNALKRSVSIFLNEHYRWAYVI